MGAKLTTSVIFMAATAYASAAVAQSTAPAPTPDWTVSWDRAFAPAALSTDTSEPELSVAEDWIGPLSISDRSVRLQDDQGFQDLRVRTARQTLRADGRLPSTRLDTDPELYDVSYRRGWTGHVAQTDRLEVAVTPHLGFGYGALGASTEAGATVTVGSRVDSLAPSGAARFGDRTRWYIYAAGSGRAVGYNLLRGRDGQLTHSGLSQDRGAFFGDASVGVGLRRGPMQASVGVAYREIELEGFRAAPGMATDATEGVLAFQFSLRPE